MGAEAARLPRASQPRRWLRAWHRWFGLLAAGWLLLVAITGSAIVFYDEIDTWLNPDWRVVMADSAGPVNVDRALAQARHVLPQFEPRFIDLPNKATEALFMMGSATLQGERAEVHVFSHPQTGALLGWRPPETLSFNRRHVMNTLYALHTDLMLGGVGAWFLGAVALAWLFDHFAGLALAFPRASKWRESFRVQGAGLRRWFDLHRAPALWMFPATLVLAVSGVCLTWYEESRSVVGWFSPVSSRLHETFADAAPGAVRIGVDDALTRAAPRLDAAVDSVVVVARAAAYGIRSFDERDLDGYGRLWTYVSMLDGRVIAQRHDNGASAGDTFFAWQYPLHSGKSFGIAGRTLILIAGLGTASLCVSGFVLWWRRRT